MTMTFSGTSGVTFPDTTLQATAATASIPAGAKTNFIQAAAPTGWTQCITLNNYAMRLVSGTGGGTGGTVAFTTAFASQAVSGSVSISGGAVASTTLSTCQIPSHAHNSLYALSNGSCFLPFGSTNGSRSSFTFATGGGASHTHTFTQPTGSFSGTAINLAVQYVDNIVATKN